MIVLITEGVKEQFELRNLTNKVLAEFAYLNTFNFIQTEKLNYTIKFKSLQLNDLSFNEGEFVTLRDFIFAKPNLKITIEGIESSNITGHFWGDKINEILIELPNENIRKYIQTHKLPDTKDSYDNFLYLKKLLTDICNSALLHELQHAYDNFRSGGKYMTDKKSNYYYKNLDILKNRYKKYLNLPHEYWARFAQATTNLYLRKDETLGTFLEQFKMNMVGWNQLPLKDKKRILRAVSQYYYLLKEKSK